MAQKKRVQRITVFGYVEGQRERAFIDFLREIYVPESNGIAFNPEDSSGGTPDKIVSTALRECHRDKSFAWLDEDFEPDHSPLSSDVRKILAKYWGVIEHIEELLVCPLGSLQNIFNPHNKKPILIVSKPVCSESMILLTLGHTLPYPTYDPAKRDVQIRGLKNKLNQLMGGSKTMPEQTAYYRQNLTKADLELRRQTIPELNLLISMITK